MAQRRSSIAVLQADGKLTPATIELLHAVTGVDTGLLQTVRISPANKNWLHAPWYPYHRGGALTIGHTIWFTRKWFAANGYGNGTPESTLRWLLHLAHEVGHLPQAERFGRSLWGKVRYVATFTGQYAKRALLFQWPVHDGSPLEREADRGRQVLAKLIDDQTGHPIVMAIHRADHHAVVSFFKERRMQERIARLTQDYTATHGLPN